MITITLPFVQYRKLTANTIAYHKAYNALKLAVELVASQNILLPGLNDILKDRLIECTEILKGADDDILSITN